MCSSGGFCTCARLCSSCAGVNIHMSFKLGGNKVSFPGFGVSHHGNEHHEVSRGSWVMAWVVDPMGFPRERAAVNTRGLLLCTKCLPLPRPYLVQTSMLFQSALFTFRSQIRDARKQMLSQGLFDRRAACCRCKDNLCHRSSKFPHVKLALGHDTTSE